MPKDWSKIEKELLAEEEKETNNQESVDEFFKKIYSNATDEQKRAMMKSFQTSNGTVLSTNWDEVKDANYNIKDEKPK
jgi:suppressor of G2 allele of SKP1